MRTVTSSFFCREGVKYDETKYRDLDGNIVRLNPMENPYNYDTYVIYKSPFFRNTDTKYCFGCGPDNSKETVNALNQMGLKLYGAPYERLCCENPQQVETFLSIIMKRKVKCKQLQKGAMEMAILVTLHMLNNGSQNEIVALSPLMMLLFQL